MEPQILAYLHRIAVALERLAATTDVLLEDVEEDVRAGLADDAPQSISLPLR